jgi:hypothetical protein
MHLQEKIIHTYLDGELSELEHKRAEAHLSGCNTCRQRADTIHKKSELVHTALSTLEPDPSTAPRPADVALSSLSIRKKDVSPPRTLSIRRPVWATLVLLVILAVTFSFPPVRAMASQLLQLFRVEQVTVFPMDTLSMSNIDKDPTLVEAISQLFSDSVIVTEGEPEAIEHVSTAAEASQLAGYSVRLPAGDLATDAILIKPGFSFEFHVDHAYVQEVIDMAGREDLALPEELDQALIQVEVPTLVSATFGGCWDDERDNDSPGGKWAEDCMAFLQAPSPAVTSPSNVDPSVLAAIGMQILGVSSEEAEAFAQAADWTTTLVLPIPRGDVDYEEVTVDGVQGHLLRYHEGGNTEYPEGYTLLWLKDGIVYAMSISWKNR